MFESNPKNQARPQVVESPWEVSPAFDSISPTGADGVQSVDEAISKRAEAGESVHSGFGLGQAEMEKHLAAGLPSGGHAQLLLAVHRLRREVGYRRGVYLVTPEVRLRTPSILHLPTQDAAERIVPWSSDTFQVVHLSLGKFDSMIARAAEVMANAERDAREVRELILNTEPKHEVVVAVVNSGVHLWPTKWLEEKASLLLQAVW